jgi:hypothetical protein
MYSGGTNTLEVLSGSPSTYLHGLSYLSLVSSTVEVHPLRLLTSSLVLFPQHSTSESEIDV